MYPYDPPFPASEFDLHDRTKFSALYYWAESADKAARWLNANGIRSSGATINHWRRQHNVPVANDAYRTRGGIFATKEPQPEASSDNVMALLEYLRNRKVPDGVPPKVKVNGSGYATEIVGCDLHFPHHHRGAWEVFLGAVERIQPQGVTLNGDSLDLAQLGRYARDPNFFVPVQSDLDQCRELLSRVPAAAPNARCTVVLGNHEWGRFENYLWTRCPELASLRCLDFESLLGLTELGWNYSKDGYWLIPDVLVLDHGSRHTNSIGGGSAQTARKEMLDIGTSGITGHTHRLGMFWRQDGIGYRVWAEGGCLCDQDRMREAGVTARKRGPSREDWHLGFLRVDYKPGGEAFTVTPIPILTNERRTFAIVEGEEVSA